MNELDKLLAEYQDQFEDNFPLMLCRHMDDDEIINTVTYIVSKLSKDKTRKRIYIEKV